MYITSATGTVYPSGAYEFTLYYFYIFCMCVGGGGGSCCSIFSFCLALCRPIFEQFLFTIFRLVVAFFFRRFYFQQEAKLHLFFNRLLVHSLPVF